MKDVRVVLVATLAMTGLESCSGMIEKTSQQVLVNTNPPGADCEFVREGSVIARISETPNGISIKKTKYDITVKCSKPGYQDGVYVNHPRAAGAPFGDIALNYGNGWLIDLADYQYDGAVNMTLVPVSPGMPPASAAPVSALGELPK